MAKVPKKQGFVPRLLYYFCTDCQARREAEDEGDVNPVCSVCGKRTLVRRMEGNAPEQAVVPTDERPENAEPYTQPVRRDKVCKQDALKALHLLVTDFETAFDSPLVYGALFRGGFPPFIRQIANTMLVDFISDWRRAVEMLPKDFCLRYQRQLEAFKSWVENPDVSAVPAFMEPEPNTEDEPSTTTPPEL